MGEPELLYQIALSLIPGIGDVLGRKLIGLYGSAEAVFREPRKFQRKIPRITDLLSQMTIRKEILVRAAREIEFLNRHHIKPLFYTDKEYPRRLKNCHDSPLMVYYKGTADLNAPRVIAVVGTRNATDYGKGITHDIITHLEVDGTLIISGLAYGIDSFAHRVCVETSRETVGVLGHGLDTIYPWINRSLAEKMLLRGGLLTEFLSGTKPDRVNFPRRNRIIAGLSDAILVVEAGQKGGALITADIANSYNRDVFAIPGRVHDPFSEGTNLLIKSNRAALVQSAGDIEYNMGWKTPVRESRIIQMQLFADMTEEENRIFEILKVNGNTGIDDLCFLSSLPMNKVSASLLNMEFEGMVRCLPGKVYTLT